jgi:hypothetical protein
VPKCPKMKGGQCAPFIISRWYYSVRFVAGGSTRWHYSGRAGPSSTCYCDYSHNYLGGSGGTVGFLAIPAFT